MIGNAPSNCRALVRALDALLISSPCPSGSSRELLDDVVRDALLDLKPTFSQVSRLHAIHAVRLEILLIPSIVTLEVPVDDILHVKNPEPRIRTVEGSTSRGTTNHLVEQRMRFQHERSERADQATDLHPILLVAFHNLINRIPTDYLIQRQESLVSAERNLLAGAVSKDILEIRLQVRHSDRRRSGDDVRASACENRLVKAVRRPPGFATISG